MTTNILQMNAYDASVLLSNLEENWSRHNMLQSKRDSLN